MSINRTPRARDTNGFTLLEVLAALVIAALALVGLFQAGSGGLFAADNAARTDEAIERARSHLAAFGRTGATTAGESEGDDGGGYHWKLRAFPVARQAAPAQAGGGLGLTSQRRDTLALYDVEVAISWHTHDRPRSIVLTTRRLIASAGAE